jgi:hypothetical protein
MAISRRVVAFIWRFRTQQSRHKGYISAHLGRILRVDSGKHALAGEQEDLSWLGFENEADSGREATRTRPRLRY